MYCMQTVEIRKKNILYVIIYLIISNYKFIVLNLVCNNN